MRILGLETSCDETSASVLSGTGDAITLESLVILSQDVHRIFGGVVPEIASRQHLTSVIPVIDQALGDAGVSLTDLDAIAVTHAPGLVGALLVGVAAAKGLSLTTGVPLVGVHHLEGHLFATSLEHPGAVPPFIALLVSGGHTLLLDVPAWGTYRLLGATRDDAAGEAFDKAAKLLGLPYPGGRHLEALARDGDPSRFRFTRPMLRRDQHPGDGDYYDVSFSGLKTAVMLAVKSSDDVPSDAAHIARGFQNALTETLAEKVARAIRATRGTRVVLGGGVACNRALVEAVEARAAAGVQVFAPSPRFATDNAAMIARAGLFHAEAGHWAALDLGASSSTPIPGLVRS
ncbi:MAG TPA: tRNA (adenosine(37)-N6)-threonylcarbamoyltransferase complex transferase subunit TsaD [Gemmatimonadaceae bacterium]|nr:tRNA (adenosine(37)-N6)-threonylcarbamoyltransferase complex transferase subunit TsaD [Gemmatimonadaceae bacterium]